MSYTSYRRKAALLNPPNGSRRLALRKSRLLEHYKQRNTSTAYAPVTFVSFIAIVFCMFVSYQIIEIDSNNVNSEFGSDVFDAEQVLPENDIPSIPEVKPVVVDIQPTETEMGRIITTKISDNIIRMVDCDMETVCFQSIDGTRDPSCIDKSGTRIIRQLCNE